MIRSMHCLEIKDRTIYLDGVRVKGVTGFELKSSAESPTAELTLKLIVEDSKVHGPEIISPQAILKNLTGGTESGTLVTSSIQKETNNMDEQRIREIVKEELAAQKKQLTSGELVKQDTLSVCGDFGGVSSK